MYRGRIFSQVYQHARRLPSLNINSLKIDAVEKASFLISHRQQGTIAVEESYVKRFMKAVGLMDQERARLKLTGFFIYECVPVKVLYEEWFEVLELPDTFASWFIVTELHVWLLLVRYMAEDVITTGGKNKIHKGDGHFVRNCIIEALWADVGNRIKFLEGANPTIARKQVTELSEQFQAALVGYDEGIDDDKVLAAADLKWKPQLNWLSIQDH
ncbi:unnamed protein product [Leptidea sinapis]|uniref:Ubiquinol-cytochrome c chaperone domain-containing protein n=1 Tax=Leptidea sinapis TaxID=189913 RepID=A0A5E4QU08_9NEOP|nr:unnamed protein product [Leptidea sinapis]